MKSPTKDPSTEMLNIIAGMVQERHFVVVNLISLCVVSFCCANHGTSRKDVDMYYRR